MNELLDQDCTIPHFPITFIFANSLGSKRSKQLIQISLG